MLPISVLRSVSILLSSIASANSFFNLGVAVEIILAIVNCCAVNTALAAHIGGRHSRLLLLEVPIICCSLNREASIASLFQWTDSTHFWRRFKEYVKLSVASAENFTV